MFISVVSPVSESPAPAAPGPVPDSTEPGDSLPPNIILIITDDQGYGPVGRHGHPWIQTPNLDRLYDQSTRFTRFLVSPTFSNRTDQGSVPFRVRNATPRISSFWTGWRGYNVRGQLVDCRTSVASPDFTHNEVTFKIFGYDFDDDGDGATDWPEDAQCRTAGDGSEVIDCEPGFPVVEVGAEGGQLEDPAGFVNKLNELMLAIAK